MRETKLYSTLVQLDGFELNRLHRFILSPYFNQSEAIIRLFEWIKNDLKSQASGQATKEDVWHEAVGKSEPYNDGRFRKLQSDLLKLVEEFFAQEAYESYPIHKAKYLLEAIYAKELKKIEAGALKTAERLTEEQNIKPASYYYYQYEIEQSKYNLKKDQFERSTKLNIEEIAKNLDRFFLAEKLRYYCTILNHQLNAALDYEILFMDEILDHVKSHDYSDVPPILIYYTIYLTYKEPEEISHYKELKRLISQHIHIFNEHEAKEIIDAALNYSLERMNAGKKEFIRETFELYTKFLSNGLLFVKGKITPWSFKNIVTTGLRLSEFNWVEEFIQQYAPLLEEEYRENAITFNLAQLYFYKKDYQKVIRLLSQVDYEDITYNLNSKTLLMASYYELDEIEALDSLLDTFRIYLNRNNKIPSSRKNHYLNTINVVRKLGKISNGDSVSIQKLLDEINASKGLVSKNWILEKLDALKA